MPEPSDTKNWTWVLERRCPECGIEAGALASEAIAPITRACAAIWLAVLARPRDVVATRPSPERWSALEYACHVADVFRIGHERLSRMVEEDDPTYANWDQDATARDDRYDEQDPRDVAGRITNNADALAALVETVRPDQFGRTGTRSDGARFTVLSLERYLMHDVLHHLVDVGAEVPAAAR